MSKIFEFYVEAFLTFEPKFKIESFKYDFDYSPKSIELFKKNYSGIIELDENFKKEYPKFFYIKRYNSHESIHFKFEFGKFCNRYNITLDMYLKMKEELKNFFPFPVKGYVKVFRGKEVFDCFFSSRVLDNAMFVIVYPGNDIYTLKYTSQLYCELQLIKDFSEKEKQEYKNFLAHYDAYNGIFEMNPILTGYF